MVENRSLDEAVQQGKALAAVQLADGLCLDLADTLTGDAEIAAHLFQRAGTAIVQTEAETDDLLFTRGQALESQIEAKAIRKLHSRKCLSLLNGLIE